MQGEGSNVRRRGRVPVSNHLRVVSPDEGADYTARITRTRKREWAWAAALWCVVVGFILLSAWWWLRES